MILRPTRLILVLTLCVLAQPVSCRAFQRGGTTPGLFNITFDGALGVPGSGRSAPRRDERTQQTPWWGNPVYQRAPQKRRYPPDMDPEALPPVEQLPMSVWYDHGAREFAGAEPFKRVYLLDSNLLIYRSGSLESADRLFKSEEAPGPLPSLGFNYERIWARSPKEEWRVVTTSRGLYNENKNLVCLKDGLFVYDMITHEVKELPIEGNLSTPCWGTDGKIYGVYCPRPSFEPSKQYVSLQKKDLPNKEKWDRLARVDEDGKLETLAYLPPNPRNETSTYPITTRYQLTALSPDCSHAILAGTRSEARRKLYLIAIETGELVEIPTKDGSGSICAAFSPDSREFAFSDNEGVHVASVADVSNKRTILAAPKWDETNGIKPWFHWGRVDSWSPDGKWIVVDMPLVRPGWFLLSPDGMQKQKIMRKFLLREMTEQGEFTMCGPLGVSYTTWSKDGRYLAGCALQGVMNFRDGKHISGGASRRIFVVDMARQEFALYFYDCEYDVPVLLFEDKDVIEKIRANWLAENEQRLAQEFERDRKDFDAAFPVEPNVVHDINSYLEFSRRSENAERRHRIYMRYLRKVYRRESMSKELRSKILAWLREKQGEFQQAYERCKEMKAKGINPSGDGVISLGINDDSGWVPPIPED